MSVDVIMPKLGESITEGTILEWKKNVGDSISKDETLLEISTDKVDSEIPSPAKGKIIEILYKVNDVVAVGEVIARIGQKSDDIKINIVDIKKKVESTENINSKEQDKPKLKAEESIKKVAKENSHIPPSSGRFYSPLVKSISKRENISFEELENLAGSGYEGRVNKHDILSYVKKRYSSDSPIHEKTDFSTKMYHLENKIEPMDHVRKMISDHMIKSRETSVHVYSTSEIDMTSIVEFRNKNKKSFNSIYETPLTYTPFIINAAIKSINEFPLMNAFIQGTNIKYNQNINIGVAVALPDNNLIVPVIKRSEELNFLGLTRATHDLASKARKGSLSPNDASGSTFTITNPGIFGSLFGMGIINQPNVGLLSVGLIHKRPVVKETEYGDVIVIRSMMYATLAYDHRLIDGAYGTKFLSSIKNYLESFSSKSINI